MAVEGKEVDTGEVDAVFVALKSLVDRTAGIYRPLITDDKIREIATAAVIASVQYRTAKAI